MKQFFNFKLFIFPLLVIIVLTQDIIYSTLHKNNKKNDEINNKKEDEDEFSGKRKLSFEKKISAENRYEKMICSFIASKKDQDLFKNDIFYIENGYYDYGFVPLFENKKCGKIDFSYWVFVYPKWYVWDKESIN